VVSVEATHDDGVARAAGAGEEPSLVQTSAEVGLADEDILVEPWAEEARVGVHMAGNILQLAGRDCSQVEQAVAVAAGSQVEGDIAVAAAAAAVVAVVAAASCFGSHNHSSHTKRSARQEVWEAADLPIAHQTAPQLVGVHEVVDPSHQPTMRHTRDELAGAGRVREAKVAAEA